MKLIECVPNFSEGRHPAVIEAITATIEAVDGARLLDVDPGFATNRTVVTFVGSPTAVEEAAYAAIAKASELIDMTTHEGEHPRMGATDVCPFVPLADATMEDCAEIARRLGRRIGDDLGIPVYLYEHAAPGGRRSLADVRSGEYEGLAEREDSPDFGPAFNPSAGATAIGARQFLVAYNINLNTRDRRLAHRVAQAVRELGAPKRSQSGAILKDESGKTIFEPGRFKEVKGIGWYIDEYQRAQVSLNLTDPTVSPVHEVFEACREEAAKLGLRVTGSELVGLIPRDVLLAAGDHFLQKQGATTGVPEAVRVQSAVLSLGLDDLVPFDARAKVIEYAFSGAPGRLAGSSIEGFLDELSGEAPAPGGGSVAALAGSLAAALASMVAALTWAKKGMEEHRPVMESAGARGQNLKDWLQSAIDRDTEAFDAVLAARRLPRKSQAEIEARAAAIAAADLGATLIPLEVLEHCVEVLEVVKIVAELGNPTSVTDAGVGGWCGLAAAEGASLNVRINLSGLEGEHEDIVRRHDAALGRARSLGTEIAMVVEERM